MKSEDESELRRLTEMLREIDAKLERESPLREGLKKSGLALIIAFNHDFRPEIEKLYDRLGTPLTKVERARLLRLGINSNPQ